MKRLALLLTITAAIGCGSNKPGGDDDGDDTQTPDGPVAEPDAASPDASDTDPPSCAAPVGPTGACNGDTLVECNGPEQVDTDCAASGQVCTWIEAEHGYGCAAAPADNVVAGHVFYEDREPLTDGGLGALTPKVARAARVAVVLETGGTVIAEATAADDGSYRLHYDAAAGTQVHILVSSINPWAGRPIRVENRQGNVHGFGGSPFAAAVSTTADVLVTDASAASEAMNILDITVGTMDMIRNELDDQTPSPLTLIWARGSNDGTYYSGEIHLLGANSDDDGYDDTVILHETGHYVEDTQGRSDSPGGGHDGSPTDPRLAWSEGFSTYWNYAVRNAPYYMDSNANGGWGSDGEANLTLASETGTMSQDISEETVSEILWDLGDAVGTDDDSVAGDHGDVVRVQSAYLKAGNFRNVGVDGVDLVDALDGWFIGVGLTPCAGARGVITTTRKFPYDFAGPAGACP